MINSRETDYALRMIRKLSNQDKIPVSTLCQSEQIPQAFGYRILSPLEKAGWIEVSRGPKGGVRLLADLHTLTLFDIFCVMNKEILLSPCVSDSYECPWKESHESICAVCSEFGRINEQLKMMLQEKSLSEILNGKDDRQEEMP